MTIIRRAGRPRHFTVVPNDLVENERLTWEARGLLVFLLSKPDHWAVNRDHLAGQAPNGITMVRRILGELESHGYLRRIRTQEEGTGRVVWESVVYDSPIGALPTDGSSTGGERAALVSTQVVRTEGEEPSPPPVAGGADPRRDPAYRFEDFWQAYPQRNGKRVGKAKTLDRWKRLSYETKAEAFRAVRHYAAAVEALTTIAKDPERFLAADYWRDWIDGPGTADRREPVRPEEKTQAAAAERLARAQGPKCEECHGVGLVEPSPGEPAVTCPSCRGSGQVRLTDPENGGPS